MHIHISQFSRWLSGKESAYQCRQCRVERPPEEGNGNPLQYYCLGNPKDREAWQATVHGLAKESDMTYQLNNNSNNNIHVSIKLYILFRVCVKKMPICCSCFLQLFSFYLFFNWRIMLCRILLFSVKPQHESAIGIYIYSLPFEPPSHLLPHPTPLGWYRAPGWAFWTIQQIPIGYLFYTW